MMNTILHAKFGVPVKEGVCPQILPSSTPYKMPWSISQCKLELIDLSSDSTSIKLINKLQCLQYFVVYFAIEVLNNIVLLRLQKFRICQILVMTLCINFTVNITLQNKSDITSQRHL